MKTLPSLDDLALFVAIADGGSLSAASVATGVPMPTLSRRMAGLERELGIHLFARGKQRYALTLEGRALYAELGRLRELRAGLASWLERETGPARVRITAGMWTTRFLARNAAKLSGETWVPEFLASNAVLDISRREADIGIRNRRPEQVWLAGRRTGLVSYAIYGRGPEVTGFVGLAGDAPTTPSDRWLRENHGGEIRTTASDARVALDLALAGIGRIVMPVFAGEGEKGLVRLSEPVEQIAHEEWLVCHHEARHDPPVRAALDAIFDLLRDRGTGLGLSPAPI